MAKKRYTPLNRHGQDEENNLSCRDCARSYDWQSPALDGHLILCRCPLKDGGKYCVFLSGRACADFIKRTQTEDNGNA